MSMGDGDHNYYSQDHRRSQLPDYNVDRQPHYDDHDHDGHLQQTHHNHNHNHPHHHPLVHSNPYQQTGSIISPSDSDPNAIPPLPSSYFRQSQQYLKRPTVKTNFENHASNSNVSGSFFTDASKADNSPDPHEFYRQYRDSFRREAGSVYGGVSGGGGTNYSSDRHEEEMLATSRPSPRTTPLGGRGGGAGGGSGQNAASGTPRWESRVENRSPLSERVGGNDRAVPRGRRQSSLQALVNKFNQTPDEVPPLPNVQSRSQSRSTSQNPSPREAVSSKSFKTRLSSDGPQSSKPSSLSNSRENNHRHLPDPSRARTPTKSSSENRRNNRGTGSTENINQNTSTSTSTSTIRTVRNARRPSPGRPNGLLPTLSQSLTDISPTAQPERRPLFGEITASISTDSDLGYGIPGPRRRRGSEGSSNMHYPNSMWKEDLEMHVGRVSPSSPTAWYTGLTPSLEGIDLDKPVPAKPSGHLHSRSRSDVVSGGVFAKHNNLSSSHGQPIMIMSPPQERHSSSSSSSPTPSKRPTHSRIPVSTGRLSVTSDSGDSSYHDARSGSGVAHAFVNHRTHPKPPTNLPTPIHPSTTPDRTSRSTTPRKSPRHRAPSPRQPSPRLPAYISEAPPVKSPPLRSSRPRQPVSSATTSASRARAAANMQSHAKNRERTSGGKNLPELGGIDFAARRERIQRAFTTKIKEKEIETERKRMSMIHDAQMQQALRERERARERNHQGSALRQEQSFDNMGGKADEDVFTTKPREGTSEELQSSHAVAGSTELDGRKVPAQEDSPTLGSAAVFLEPAKYRDHEESSDAEPRSAVTSGTAETFFDNEPQEETAIDATKVVDSGAKEAPASQSLLEVTHVASPHLRLGEGFFGSDRDEGESIQIHLQETPIRESGNRGLLAQDDRASHKEGPMDSNELQTGHQAPVTDSRWSMSSWTSSNAEAVPRRKDSPPLERITESSPAIDGTTVNSGSTITQGPWSPGTHSSSFTSAPSTHNSDPYNFITRVLDNYHDPTLMSDEDFKSFQQRLFDQAPSLEKAGNLNSQTITQLYVQDVVRNDPTRANADPDPSYLRSGDGIARSDSPCVPVSIQEPSQIIRNDYGLDGHAAEAEKERAELDASVMKSPAVTQIQRASASLTNPDDWANTSPSMLDWIHHQAMDSPVEQSNKNAFFPTPRIKTVESYGSGRSGYDSPILPDIERTGGLGIDITVDSPYEVSSDPPTTRPLPPTPAESFTSPTRSYGMQNHDVSASPSVRSRSPSIGPRFVPRSAVLSKPSTPDSTIPTNGDDGQRYTLQRSKTEAGLNKQPSGDATSTAESVDKNSLSLEDQKRLKRRKHILKEIVDTESSFGQDMTVVVDIYKGTSNVILNSPEDVKILFGNAAEIVQFSLTFLDALKHAAKTVYVLPKSKRWKTKRDSNATNESGTTDDQSSMSGLDLSDDEKDRMTSIGSAFEQNLTQMEKVYTDYLKNHDAANQKLAQLQKSEKVKIWLKECRAYAHDLTTAWDLDSLLVKPVQRILKYPLLLKELLECTPDNHPDFVALDTSAREMVGVSMRINEAKKRADLVEKANGTTNSKNKRKESDGRLLLPKAFGRRTEKLKQQVGLSETVQDPAYTAVSEKFGSHYFQLQVVMRDVEMYLVDIQSWVNKFNDFVLAIEAHMDVAQTGYPEIESKWRRFRLSVKEIQMTALTDHTNAVRKNVIEPMITLLKLHEGPQRLMDKRKKRVLDYAKFKAVMDRGDKPDKKTTEQGEQFKAINDTLKDELPKLFLLTANLVEACLQNFVQLQLQWMNVWKAKLRQAIEASDVPQSFAVIIDQFSSDFRYTEAQVLSLGLCNGALLADSANFVHFISPDRSTLTGTTLNDDTSSRRPSMATENSRSRAASNATADPDRARGFSTSSSVSPMLPSPDFGRPSDGFGLAGHLGSHNNNHSAQTHPPTGRRLRASSAASGRSPISPEQPSSAYGRGFSVSGASGGAYNRPSTASGREDNYSRRPSHNGSSRASSDRLHPDADPRDVSRYAGSSRDMMSASSSSNNNNHRRNSGIFSSAMPMSDSPRTASPTSENHQEFNVLFLAASVYEFNIDRARREAGYPYLTYVAGEIFDVIGEKGELWLAKNQDDSTNQVGWIWNKHFAKLAS